MLRQDLLNKELNDYKNRMKIELKPIKYNRDFIFNLFRKYKNYNMTENSYCCCGEETCCWQELIEEGNWSFTLNSVRLAILDTFKETKHYLRSINKYKNRMYIYQDKDKCYIYIYLRDLTQTDYHIWFDNNTNN